MRPLGALCLAAVLPLGCSSTTSVAPYAADAQPPLHVQITTAPPADAAGQVDRDAVVRIVLDDLPDPTTASYGDLVLRSGRGSFDIDLRVELVDRAIVMAPRSLLDPNTTYEVLVAPAVRALDGRTVGGSGASATLTVGADLNPSPSPTPAPAVWSGAPCDATDPAYDPNNPRCILAGCAPACHSPVGASGRARNPTRRLDLTGDPRDPVLGLVGVPSVSLEDTPEQLLRVQPGDGSRSVLVRKLLGGDPHLDSHDPPYPQTGVPGRRMPLNLDDSAADPLPDDQLHVIQAWIDQGAQVTP